MKDNFKLYAHDKLVRISIIVSGICIIILSGILLFLQGLLPPLVPFLNSMPWGDQRLVPSQFVLLGVPVVVAFFLLNTLLGVAVYQKHTLASRILSINSALFILLSVMAYVQILFLIF